MIDTLQLREFKPHLDTKLTLGRLTVLVGPNGAGKTSVLQALELMTRLAGSQWAQVFVGRNDWNVLRRRGGEGDSYLEIAGDAESGGESWALGVEVLRVPEWNGSHGGNLVGKCYRNRDNDPEEVLVFEDEAFSPRIPASLVGTAQILRLDPGELAAPSAPGVVEPVLGSRGERLADVLAHLSLSEPERMDALQHSLRAVVPEIERVRISRAALPEPADSQSPRVGHEVLFDVAGSKGIPAHAMSEGTLVALGLLTVLWSPRRPSLLLIDGLEHSLHPRAQWELLAQIRRILDQFPELQIVATTHSPDLVDRLEVDEVVVMSLASNGAALARPLRDCPRKDMLDVLGAGELWSALGEAWVTEAAP